ncbi:acetylcholinesterase-1-like isoform X1 [Ornithodoros turicata]|uniref:acetylcholinesterase-1-like isoform X1 n=1 Tax=Ornithodoros turicata TaxID=34597 RepID=UPI0031396F6E
MILNHLCCFSTPNMKALLLQVVSVCCTVGASSLPYDAPVVRTNLGAVAGTRLTAENGKSVDAFYGIPYAIPPTGKRRFLRPHPPFSWNGVLNATHRNPGCVQTDLIVVLDVTLNMSNTVEDCLYLNIWTPRRDCSIVGSCSKPLSVLVYIYGGGFSWGTSALLLYDGLEFASRANMVFVSFNYRVGILGFLNASSQEAPGNMGLYDQVEALRWVKDNIHYFGGDPESVTIAGQSAGGISVSYLTMSKLSKGLFRRAVILSGTPGTLAYGKAADAHQNFRSATSLFGCSDPYKPWDEQISQSIECLRKVDPHEMVNSLYKHLMLRYITFLPGYGDDVLPNDPLDHDSMNVHTKELLLGVTEDDGAFLVSQFYAASEKYGIHFDGRQILRMVLMILYQMSLRNSRAINEEYFGDSDDIDDSTLRKTFAQIVTDLAFECPADTFATTVCENGATVYRYVFSHRPSYSYWPEWTSATHNDDVPFFLGTIRIDPDVLNATYGSDLGSLYKGQLPTAEEFQFSDEMLETVAQFAKTGKPKIPKTDKEWPKYTKENKAYLILKPNDYKVAHGPRSTKCHLWEPYLVKRKATTPHPTPAQKPRPTPKRGHEKRPKIKVQQLDNNIAAASRASATVVEAATFVLAAVTVLLTTREL